MRLKKNVATRLTSEINRELESQADPGHAATLKRFFKTGPGECGEGDRFRGIRVPVLRKVARKYRHLSLSEAVLLLQSTFHEDRLLALLILIHRYYQGDNALRDAIHRLYLEHRNLVNNWDLVDASAPHLVGHYLKEHLDRDPDPLTRLAASRILWERRMAILATFHFIKQGDHDETLRVARMLLGDPEDLIHKAVGWMLREVGKRDLRAAEGFLQAHYRRMPRTMLRYAIERFPETRRQAYLKGAVI
jgi:3-methyladenine DNA glycosylase AlkD